MKKRTIRNTLPNPLGVSGIPSSVLDGINRINECSSALNGTHALKDLVYDSSHLAKRLNLEINSLAGHFESLDTLRNHIDLIGSMNIATTIADEALENMQKAVSIPEVPDSLLRPRIPITPHITPVDPEPEASPASECAQAINTEYKNLRTKHEDERHTVKLFVSTGDGITIDVVQISTIGNYMLKVKGTNCGTQKYTEITFGPSAIQYRFEIIDIPPKRPDLSVV